MSQDEATSQNQPISGQQLAALQKAAETRYAWFVRDIETKKWAVTQAVSVRPGDPLALAREIHAFLTEGAKASD
jgi:hypothetical protein